MTTGIVPTMNGHPTTLTPTSHPGSGPGAQVDRLLEVRQALRRLQDEDQRLTRELVGTLRAQGLQTLSGTQAVAIRALRTTLTVDPVRFHAALGPVAFQAFTVNLTAARQLVGEATLATMGETSTTPVLRVEPRE